MPYKQYWRLTKLFLKISHIMFLQNYQLDQEMFLLLSQPDHIVVEFFQQFFKNFFHWLISLFLWPDFVILIGFQLIFIISYFDYLHLIVVYFSSPFSKLRFELTQFFDIATFFYSIQEVPSYLDLLVHSGKVEKCRFVTHELA